MEIEIHLENDYFPWEKVEIDDQVCWVKGDLFFNDELLQGSAILSLISSLSPSSDDPESLKELLLGFNGSYALVIQTPDTILCVVDRLRSIPLFYAKTDARLIISDDANYIRDRISPPFDEKNGAEFLVTGYVTGPETLFDGVNQIQAGEYVKYAGRDDLLAASFYYRFWHENYYSASEEELLDRLDRVFVRVFERLIASIRDRELQIVVPLSGGLDSRIIVSMLKRCGVDDVICFTYGRKGNREAKISQQVAEALGYQWHFVEYSKDNLNDRHELIEKYMDYAGNLGSSPHLQDLLAVDILIEQGTIPENAIFIPGHSGDMLAGSHIPHVSPHSQEFSDAAFLQHVLETNYRLWTWDGDAELYQIFKEKIMKTVAGVVIHDKESWANAIELWDYQERQAKYIVNSVRVYEFFRCPWRIPLWDTELIDFFAKIPLHYRMAQCLYRKYAAEKLFVNALRDLGRIECTTPLSDKPQPPDIVKGLLSQYRVKVNFFLCIFSFDIGCALVWAVDRQNLSLLKIRSAIFGYRSDSYRDYKIINEIMVRTQNARAVPTANSLGSHTYLTHIL